MNTNYKEYDAVETLSTISEEDMRYMDFENIYINEKDINDPFSEEEVTSFIALPGFDGAEYDFDIEFENKTE